MTHNENLFADNAMQTRSTDANNSLNSDTSQKTITSYYQQLFYTTCDAILIANSSGNIVEANPAARHLFGFPEHENLVGANILSLTPERIFDVPRDELFQRYLTALQTNGNLRFEWIHLRRDNTEFTCEIVANLLASGDDFVMFGIVRDLSRRNEFFDKRDQIQKRIYQSQKLESLGRLSGGIAHDFNNILAIVNGYSELALRYNANRDVKMQRYLQTILDAGNRAKELVKHMLTFSRGDLGQQSAIDINAFTRDAIKNWQSSFPSTIEIKLSLPADRAIVFADPNQLNQAILNLLINSRYAMHNEKGRIQITVRQGNYFDEECSSCRIPFSGEYVEIEIEDDGDGITNQDVTQIFEPFFSTKTVNKGSGLGLSVVHGIVHSSQGHIIVSNGATRGAVFRLCFPAYVDSTMNDDKIIPEFNSEPAAQTRILVVDDEQNLLEYMAELLRGFGYDTTIFSNAKHALEYFELHADDVDLVITDQTMPLMNGIEVIAAIRKIKPTQRIILNTGYSSLINEKNLATIGADVYLEKPIDTSRLAAEVAKLLKR